MQTHPARNAQASDETDPAALTPEGYRDTWHPLPPALWRRYPQTRAQATVGWFAAGERLAVQPPIVFRRLDHRD